MIHKFRQEGTTLVEVLIAAIIIAIGLLGIATLQVKALQASTNAEHRANAIDIASSLADRIRANILGKASYVPDPPDSDACPTSGPSKICSMTPGGSVDDVDSCTPNEMSEYDLFEICNAEYRGLKNQLPEAKLEVNCIPSSCGDDSEMRIHITWQLREQEDDGTAIKDGITLLVIPGTDYGAP